MTTVTSVSLSLSGTINGQSVTASGTLSVDETTGTKSGNVSVNQPPGSASCGPDGYAVPMPRCFIGARPVKPNVVNPLRLLGRRFDSVRVTDLGSAGWVAHTEHASLAKGTLTSRQSIFGEMRHGRVTKVTGIREVIQVAGPGHLSAEGRYTLVIGSGRTAKKIPVTYRQSYRTATPDRKLFGAHKNKKFLLKAEVRPNHHGQVVSVRTNSTIEYI